MRSGSTEIRVGNSPESAGGDAGVCGKSDTRVLELNRILR